MKRIMFFMLLLHAVCAEPENKKEMIGQRKGFDGMQSEKRVIKYAH